MMVLKRTPLVKSQLRLNRKFCGFGRHSFRFTMYVWSQLPRTSHTNLLDAIFYLSTDIPPDSQRILDLKLLKSLKNKPCCYKILFFLLIKSCTYRLCIVHKNKSFFNPLRTGVFYKRKGRGWGPFISARSNGKRLIFWGYKYFLNRKIFCKRV